MKKAIIAVFSVLAVASAAGAQETGWNFEGRGAAVPMPVMERAVTPQRLVSMDGMSEEKLGALLKKAARSQNKSTITCSFAGPINLGDMVCGSECCLVDMDGDGEGDTTDCHLIEPCFPVEKPDTKAAGKKKANPVTGLVSALKKAGKTRGPYEDCINYCIDAWQDCNGDKCGDDYQRCINVCDNVVNKP